VSNRLKGDARVLELERELDVMKASISWRITAPLRRVNHWRRMLASGGVHRLARPSRQREPRPSRQR
jgi:hypothetical protein